MAKKSAKNSGFLKEAKYQTSPRIYEIILKLFRDGREDLAEEVFRIDYILDYAEVSLKQRDYREAKESLSKARKRIDLLKSEGVDTEFLDYIYEGIEKKLKK